MYHNNRNLYFQTITQLIHNISLSIHNIIGYNQYFPHSIVSICHYIQNIIESIGYIMHSITNITHYIYEITHLIEAIIHIIFQIIQSIMTIIYSIFHIQDLIFNISPNSSHSGPFATPHKPPSTQGLQKSLPARHAPHILKVFITQKVLNILTV